MKLTLDFPEFIDYTKQVCDEFRELYANAQGCKAHCIKKIAVLSGWGRYKAWGNHMVHHAIYYKNNYSYAGVIEALSGSPFDVDFISFEDILKDKDILNRFDIVMNIGDANTGQTGGKYWSDERILTAVRDFIYNGGGFIGVGEPSGYNYQGRTLQLATQLGVELENGFTLAKGKYYKEVKSHFITEEVCDEIYFGEGNDFIYALDGTEILALRGDSVQLACKEIGKGRTVYISGLPYSLENNRLLYRAILWASHDEEGIHRWFSTNLNVEVNAYVENNKFCVVNNTYESQVTIIYKGDGSSFELKLEPNEIKWFEIEGKV